MKLRLVAGLGAALALPTAAGAAAGGTLFGTSVEGSLFTVDTTYARGTFVGSLGLCDGATEIEFSNVSRRAFAQCRDGAFAGFEFDIGNAAAIGGVIGNGAAFTGLEAVGATWYGTAIHDPGGLSELRILDPFTGASTLVGPTGVGPISGLAYDKANRTMYAIAGGPGPADLYTIDLDTGTVAVVGSTGIQAGSLEFGPDGRLYAGGTGSASAGNLYVIDPATGASTLVGSTGLAVGITGLTLVEPVDPPCGSSSPFLDCGFETGLASWITQDVRSSYVPLRADGAGVTAGFGFFGSIPPEGSLAALHGFDGDGPGHIELAQDVTLPGGAVLEFDYRAAWNLTDFCSGCANRTFDVRVEPPGGGTPLATTRILTATAGTTVLDTGNQTGAVDLGAFGGHAVRIVFDWLVPESFTGPGFFQLDAVRVNAANDYYTVTPCRVIDTRSANGELGGPALAAGAERSFAIAGTCGIPPTARAVSVTIAVTGATAAGDLSLFRAGTGVPLVSSINYSAAQTRSNNAIVALSAGEFSVFTSQAAGIVHFLLDVTGYFQ
jgi:hypothetical protein